MIMLLSCFPLVITFLGKDALTVSTLSIYFCSFLFLIQKITSSESLRSPANSLILCLILIAVLSTLSVPSGELRGPAVRHFSNFLSSMMLFFYISNLTFEGESEKSDFVETFLCIILLLLFLQIIIYIFISKFPQYSHFLNYFTYSNSHGLTPNEPPGIVRARSLIFVPESFGEFIAVLCPIVLYKLFYRNSYFYFIIFVFLALGLILTVTRSGIILFVFGTLVFFIYNFKGLKLSSFFLCMFGFGALMLIIASWPGVFDSVIERYSLSYQMYKETGELAVGLNRSGVWNMDYVLAHINSFGHGLFPPYFYGGVDFHLHNLYLTVLFQFGIVGMVFYFAFFYLIFKRLLNAFAACSLYPNKALIFSMILSLFLFLINEFKFEFNRYETYQQICWALFAAFYLVSKSPLNLN